MKNKEIIIVGAGTFAHNVISYLEEDEQAQWSIRGLVDRDPKKLGEKISGFEVIGSDSDLPALFDSGIAYAILGFGTTGEFDMGRRRGLFDTLKNIGFIMATVISPKAVVHKTADIGEGVIVPPQCVVDPDAVLGDDVVLSPFVYVSHHVVLGKHIFVSSFTNFVGGVAVGDESIIGMSTTICKNVGARSIIHPKTLVLEDVEDDTIGFGNPMRKMKRSLFSQKVGV